MNKAIISQSDRVIQQLETTRESNPLSIEVKKLIKMIQLQRMQLDILFSENKISEEVAKKIGLHE